MNLRKDHHRSLVVEKSHVVSAFHELLRELIQTITQREVDTAVFLNGWMDTPIWKRERFISPLPGLSIFFFLIDV